MGLLKFLVTAVAPESSQITFIPIDIFCSVLKANPRLSFNLMMFFADELKDSEKKIRLTNLFSAKNKISCALGLTIEAFGFEKNSSDLLAFTPTRKDIANFAGTTYETLIRVLGDLEKSGYIVQEGKVIRIVDKDYFKSIGVGM